MKNVILLSLLFVLLFNSKIFSFELLNDLIENHEAITIGNNVNIRKGPSINDEVITQVSIGDVVYVQKISTNRVEIDEHLKQYHYVWIRIRYKNIEGWACNAYFVPKFIYNKSKGFIAWAEMTLYDGASNPFDIVVYDVNKKKKQIVAKVDATDIYFSDLGNYFAVDSGSDVVGDLIIGKLPSGDILIRTEHDRSAILWQNDTFIFTKAFYNQVNRTYFEEKYIFKYGKILKMTTPR